MILATFKFRPEKITLKGTRKTHWYVSTKPVNNVGGIAYLEMVAMTEFNVVLCADEVHNHFRKEEANLKNGFEVVISDEPDPGYSVELTRPFQTDMCGDWETDLSAVFEYSVDLVLDGIAEKHKPPFYATLYYMEQP